MFGVIILPSPYKEKWNEKWEQLILQVFTRNSTGKKRNEELLLDPKVRHWIGLKKVSLCASWPASPFCVPRPDAGLSFRD